MAHHRKSPLRTHTEYKDDLAMPAEYFNNTLRPQLCSLFEEDALKDTTIFLRLYEQIVPTFPSTARPSLGLTYFNHRASSIAMSSFILSLLSPVLRTMVCGNFRERICKEMSLDDVDVERLLKLVGLDCGKEVIVAKGIEELLDLGELAERLQMTEVRIEVEEKLLEEENCFEMIQGSEARGLELLQKECYKMLRDEFGVISQKEGFLKLSEETMWALLEEDELGVSREEDVFEAVVRWISDSDERMVGLLRKIRYGVVSNEYLAGQMTSASLPGYGMVKVLVGEAMAKKGGAAAAEGMWDGVERLCDRWMVARGMKGRIMGADVLKGPMHVAMDGQGRVVVNDPVLREIIVFNHDGSVARRFVTEGAAGDSFIGPRGVAVDRQGNIVVADRGNHRIQVLNADGSVARCFGSKGSAVGQLDGPCGIAIDREGHIVVADHGNHRIQVFDADGSVVCHFGSHGADIGQFDRPMDVAVDGAGRIVVVDWGNPRVQVFNGDGTLALCFGSKDEGPGRLDVACAVAVDSAGRFVVCDLSIGRVLVFNADGSVARVVDSVSDNVCSPCGVVVDGADRIIVAECGWNPRVLVL